MGWGGGEAARMVGRQKEMLEGQKKVCVVVPQYVHLRLVFMTGKYSASQCVVPRRVAIESPGTCLRCKFLSPHQNYSIRNWVSGGRATLSMLS